MPRKGKVRTPWAERVSVVKDFLKRVIESEEGWDGSEPDKLLCMAFEKVHATPTLLDHAELVNSLYMYCMLTDATEPSTMNPMRVVRGKEVKHSVRRSPYSSLPRVAYHDDRTSTRRTGSLPSSRSRGQSGTRTPSAKPVPRQTRRALQTMVHFIIAATMKKCMMARSK